MRTKTRKRGLKRGLKGGNNTTRKVETNPIVKRYGCSGLDPIPEDQQVRAKELDSKKMSQLLQIIENMKNTRVGLVNKPKKLLISLIICIEMNNRREEEQEKATEENNAPTEDNVSAQPAKSLPKKSEIIIGETTDISCNPPSCPAGLRCSTDKKCFFQTKLILRRGVMTEILTIHGKRKKFQSNISMYEKHISYIRFLKKFTGPKLKSHVHEVLKNVINNKIEFEKTSVGDLKDELIIRILDLEDIIRARNQEIPIVFGVPRNTIIEEGIEDVAVQETKEPEPEQDVAVQETNEQDPEEDAAVQETKEPEPDEDAAVQETNEPEQEQDPEEDTAVQETKEQEPDEEPYEEPDEDAAVQETKEQEPEEEAAPILDLEQELVKLQDRIGSEPFDKNSKEHNSFLRNKELINREGFGTQTTYDFLYPELDDPMFNAKLATHKQFQDTQYDGNIYDIREQADKMCNSEFELTPHQLFVRNFLSYQTPYNALLLYHGLGTGKTCSAIGISEEMRQYMANIGLKKRIIIIASPNVQANFKMQLFDERKLKQINGVWSLNTCIGNALLSEINPVQYRNITRNKLVSQINAVIKQNYMFMGYGEFANYVKRKIQISDVVGSNKSNEIAKIKGLFNGRLIVVDEVHNIRIMQDNKESKKTANMLMKIAKYANNMRLLLLSATPMFNSYKEIIWITNLLNTVDNRSVIKESDVFDKTGEFQPVRADKDGNQLEAGRELIVRKLTGYISYVRGENPYTFPYRIHPKMFDESKTLVDGEYPTIQMNGKSIDAPITHIDVYLNDIGSYQKSTYDFIIDRLMKKDTNITTKYGKVREMPSFENMESFGYNYLREPIEALNMSYPNPSFDAYMEKQKAVEEPPVEEQPVEQQPENSNVISLTDDEQQTEEQQPEKSNVISLIDDEQQPQEVIDLDTSDDESDIEKQGNQTGGADDDIPEQPEQPPDQQPDLEELELQGMYSSLTGSSGLNRIMSYKTATTPQELRYDYDYKPEMLEKYGRIFSPEHISKYSSKISNICDKIRKSKGIVMIYSQYIDGGVVPMSLALEEMGFTRYGSASHTKSLFAKPPTDPIDALTLKPLDETENRSDFSRAQYVMITGSRFFSPNNTGDLNYITTPENKDGKNVKVILITRAAAEGLDFKNIRQLHIMEPWYNMNRIEQIIGRTVRNLSHCNLPFEERNVELYLHSTRSESDKEYADLYVYRFAEKKALQISKVNRILKETSVDCILNIGQTNLTAAKLIENAANQNIKIRLSSMSDTDIDYKIGDQPGSDQCDYMDTCEYTCNPSIDIASTEAVSTLYNDEHAKMNYSSIVKRLRDLFREQTTYKRDYIISYIQSVRNYPIDHIDFVLSRFVDNPNEPIFDTYGRVGYLVNRDDFYAFQPLEVSDTRISNWERTAPIGYKHTSLNMELPTRKKDDVVVNDEPSILQKNTEDENNVSYNFLMINNDVEAIRRELLQNIDLMNEMKTKPEKIPSTNTNWYKHLGIIYKVLTDNHSVPVEYITKYIIYHYLDTLSIKKKLILVYYLYKSESFVPADNIETHLLQYFDGKRISSSRYNGIILGDEKQIGIYIQVRETRQWKEVEASEKDEIMKSLRSMIVSQSKMQPFVGFMHSHKNEATVFKMKDLTEKRNNKGAYCNIYGKLDIVKRLNRVLVNAPYNQVVKEYNKTDMVSIMKPGTCVLMEILLRYFTDFDNTKNGSKYFFDLESARINDIPSLRI